VRPIALRSFLTNLPKSSGVNDMVTPSVFPIGNIIGIPAAYQQNIPDREHSSSTGRYFADYSRSGIDITEQSRERTSYRNSGNRKRKNRSSKSTSNQSPTGPTDRSPPMPDFRSAVNAVIQRGLKCNLLVKFDAHAGPRPIASALRIYRAQRSLRFSERVTCGT
jgi:hypothetical protein